MSDDIIWALDQRERCIACPSAPVANAVVLQLSATGSLPREEVAEWARAGVMAAGVTWPGLQNPLTADDWLDLEDAVTGLGGLAQVVALHTDPELAELTEELARRTHLMCFSSASRSDLRAELIAAAPTR